MANIKIYGVLVNDTTEGIVTRADQILDTKRNKKQEDINSELYEVIEKFADPTVTYDDYVTKDSDNAVKSKGVYTFVEDATSHMPYVGDDGYVYVWDLELGEYRRTGTNLRGPAGETGGTVHLIFDTTLIKINNLGQMYPNGPFRVRVVKQYGETGLDPFKDGCVKWWVNGIENENEPDGWIGWSESGNEEYGEKKGVTSGEDMSDFTITINPDHYDTITFVLYIDKKGTKVFDQQCIFVIRDPAIYKLDLTNENSMVPMSDGDGNVDDAYFETTQAILYHGAEQVPFKDINYAIESSDGVTASLLMETDEVTGEEVCMGKVSVSNWQAAFSVASVKISAEYPKNSGTKFYAIYTITRVSGVTIYRLQPSVTNIKKKKDGTYNTDRVYANVFRVDTTNSGGRTTKVDSFAAEGLTVRYTYNNKVESAKDIYTLNTTDESIPVHGDDLPKTLDGDVSEIDIYVVKDSQELTNLDLFIDHETVPVVEDGDDGIVLYLDNSDCTVNCTAEGKQVGQIWNTQGILMRGITDLSKDALWDVSMEPANGLSSMPQYSTNPGDPPGYLTCAGCVMKDNIDQVKVILSAKYPNNDAGAWFKKAYTITKAKQGKPGESGYKSTVFCRTNKVPDTPQNGQAGGTYEKPVPTHWVTAGGEPITNANGDNIKWSDGIPTDSSESIWASSRYFNTLGENTTSWTQPSQMTDTATFNVEFTWFDPYIGTPDTEPDKWFDPVEDAQEFQEHSMVYMATQNIQNGDPVMFTDPVTGQETSWTIVRVLGEKGEATVRSMVFARSEKQPATPVGGDIENPMPDPNPGADGITWSDGMPSGDFLHPVWTSMRTFSSLKGLGTDWSEPMVIKDVPGYYDVQYSTVYDNPGDPTNNPGNWYDPEDSGVTVEMQVNTWWMAQRWYGIEWSKDGGITPEWSEWDIFRVRGENGKDGSKAIPRMRGDWEEDISYDDWILSGFYHNQVDLTTGETVEIAEAYQDLVYRKIGEKQECFKCLISHQKNDVYDPANAVFEWNQKVQADISKDGVWMKAVSYEFLSTRLLNAEQIIANVVAGKRAEIFGEAPGKWKGTDNDVYTRVVTEAGKIEFEYKLTDDGRDDTWVPLIQFGYEPKVGGGVLKFFRDGKQLYDLGPTGLSASEVNSPYCETLPYYESGYMSDTYLAYGVIFEDEELKNISDASGNISDVPMSGTKLVGREYTVKRSGWTLRRDDKDFYYKKLKTGSFIPQMTLPFDTISPIPIYDPVTDTVVSGAEVPFEGDPVWYPSASNPVIQFGPRTIGFMALNYPDVKYHNVGFSWAQVIDRSYGILTYPLRGWNCVSETLTSLHDIDSMNDNGNYGTSIGSLLDIYCSGGGIFPFHARLDSISTEYGNEYLYHFILGDGTKQGDSQTTAKGGHKLFNALMGGYEAGQLGEIDIDKLLESGYVKLESGNESELMSLSACEDVIREALLIVCKTISNFANYGPGSHGGFGMKRSANGSLTLTKGLQYAFYLALGTSGIGSTGNRTYRSSAYLAKNIINKIIRGGYDVTNKNVIGYIFPENQYFKFEDFDNYDSRDNVLQIVKLGEGETLVEQELLSGTEYSVSTNGKYSIFDMYQNMPVEDQSKHRAYLMVDSLSGKMGSTVTETSGAIGNTYEISMEMSYPSGGNSSDYSVTIKYKAVPKISAYLEAGKNWMLGSSGYSGGYYTSWANNYFVRDWLYID